VGAKSDSPPPAQRQVQAPALRTSFYQLNYGIGIDAHSKFMKKNLPTWSPRILLVTAAAVALALTSGCATHYKPVLTPKSTRLDLSKGPVVLFSMVVSNGYKPSCPPVPVRAEVLSERKGAVRVATHDLGKIPGTLSSTSGRVRPIYPLAFQVSPGRSVLRGVTCMTVKPMLIMAECRVPLLLPMDLPPGKVVYAGRIEAVNRPRAGDELRAGPVVPLVDEAAAGYSGGAFDVRVVDASAEDLAFFKQEFPALRDHTIETMLWPAWVRLTKDDMNNASEIECFGKLFKPAK
jgi:hypothetical protein